MRRAFLWTVLVSLCIVLVSCGALDQLTGVRPDGTVQPGTSPLINGGQTIAPLAPSPWGELGLGALLLLQNAYILIRKIQGKIASGKTKES